MTPEFALRLARAACRVMARYSDKKLVLIGTDTRRSCAMLEAAMLSGVLSEGYDCALLRTIPTAGVAFLARKMAAAFGVMISASHNPWTDNGIKLFGHQGFKLADEIEAAIEAELPARGKNAFKNRGVGRVIGEHAGFPPVSIYINHLLNVYPGEEIAGTKLVIDCANGSACSIARPVFSRIAADCELLHIAPNGANINERCGSTHIDSLCAYVRESEGPTIGIAFDGDADRVLMVDEAGEFVDGDELVALLAVHMKRNWELSANRVVVTVMSNLGFMKAMEREGIDVDTTPVGDKNVLQRMIETGAMVGGEQSGHIILPRHNTTGDGFATALAVLDVMRRSGKPLHELKGVMRRFPQVLKNVRVKDKAPLATDPEIRAVIDEVERALAGRGRLLIRPSGTEPLVRVMAEGEDAAEIEALVDRACAVIARRLA